MAILALTVGFIGSANAWHAGLPPGAVGPNLTEIDRMLRAGELERSIEAIESLSPYLEGESLDVARFLLGKAQITRQNPEGVRSLEAIRSGKGVIEERTRTWLIRGHILSEETEKAVALYESSRLASRPTIENVRLGLDLAELVAKRDTTLRAFNLVAFMKVRQLAWDEQVRWLRLKAEAEPDNDKRAKALRTLSISHPQLPLETLTLTNAERFRRAERLSKRWHYEAALSEFDVLMKTGYRRAMCAWNMAVILQSKLRREPSRVRKLLKRFTASSTHQRHEEALYRTIRAYIKEDLYTDALRLIDVYDTTFPNGTFSEKTAYYRGWLPYDANECRRGLPALREYVKRFKKRRRHVRGFIAWCHIRHARWKSAIRAYTPLLRESDSMHGGKARYWQAYAYRQLGNTESAKERLAELEELYPHTYYSFLGKQLDARMEGRPSHASAMDWPPPRPTSKESLDNGWSWPIVSGKLKRRFKLVRTLSELGELAHARSAYGSIRDRVEKATPVPQRARFIAFIGRAIEDFNRGYKATGIKRGSGKGMSPKQGDERWHAAFPFAYRSLVERLSRKALIHPYFVYAIMRAESAYLASAVSHAEAVGALQMIRPTALKIADEIGATYDPRTFRDPRVGFQYSVHYMRKHLDVWKGNFLLAAASYNAGPEPVAKWVRAHQGKPLAFVVEEFVYNEARTYARRVAEYLLRYLALYPVEPHVRRELLDALFPSSFAFKVPKDVGY